MIKNREEIKTFILTLESEFPVNDWQLDGFYFWPIIRIRLFFYLIRQVEYKDNISKISPNKESSNNWMDFLIKLKKIISFLYTPIWFARLPKKENLFIAQDAHRVNFKGKRYNRFFDTFIETYGLENKSMYFEMTGVPKHEKERGHLLYDYEKPLKAYLKRARMKSNVGSGFKNKTYRNFLAYLESLPQTKKFAPKYTEKRLSDWYYKTVIPKTDFFTKVLKRIKPKQITILCYYSENIMMLIAAANKLVIKTVEMQHGPQSPLHLCYASWKHLPVDGYQVLPRVYWCWDEQSTQTIR
ncbi:MAG: hypothetical protein CMC15_10630, partial [Flavobacteriaceae bacterium]|nr:hypothetical protein [Flavobacteriaceae bacterium]